MLPEIPASESSPPDAEPWLSPDVDALLPELDAEPEFPPGALAPSVAGGRGCGLRSHAPEAQPNRVAMSHPRAVDRNARMTPSQGSISRTTLELSRIRGQHATCHGLTQIRKSAFGSTWHKPQKLEPPDGAC
jgi:hypothetical protein